AGHRNSDIKSSLNPSSSVTKKAKAILEREQSLENPTATEYWITLNKNSRLWLKNLRRYKIRKATQDVNTIASLAGVKGPFIKI
ncbi:unnamed protein product, partial [Acanthoscelides obtectus]